MRRPAWMLWAFSSLMYVFLYAPLVVVIVYSFNAARYGAGWKGFTTRWYLALFQNPLALNAAWNTLLLATFSTLAAIILGTMLGLGLHRYQFPGKKWFAGMLYIPVVAPDIVMAVALMTFFATVRSWLGIFNLGLSTMVLAHVTFQIPFVAIVVRSRLVGLDPAYEEAAQDLGATPWQTFWQVTFPLILPGVIAGGMLAFTLSLDDFVVSFFTTGPGATTLPILIYSSVKRGITPDINALSTLMIAVSVLATILVALLRRSGQNYKP